MIVYGMEYDFKMKDFSNDCKVHLIIQEHIFREMGVWNHFLTL